MKFSIAILAVASLVMAGPPEKDGKGERCTPVAYRCKGNGWEVCTAQGFFVNGGECPKGTVCKFYAPSMSPYCVPPRFEFP